MLNEQPLGILLTRTSGPRRDVLSALAQAGVPAVELTVTEIRPLPTLKWPDVPVEVLVFLSQAAVFYGQAVLKRYPTARCVAIGPSTQRALRELVELNGRIVELPMEYSSEGILEHLKTLPISQCIGVVTGLAGRDVLQVAWRADRRELVNFMVYERVRATPAETDLTAIREAISHGLITLLTATSVQLLDDSLAILNLTPAQIASLTLISLSERISIHAQSLGFKSTIIAESAEEDSLVKAITHAWHGRFAASD